jgi:hypothetical protein
LRLEGPGGEQYDTATGVRETTLYSIHAPVAYPPAQLFRGSHSVRAGPWVQVTAAGPSPRWGHVAVLDPKRHQGVVFGGVGGGSEIWIFSLDSQSWQRINPPNGPSTLGSARAVGDPSNDRMVIVGGTSGGTEMGQVWSFSFGSQTWSQLPTGPSPRFDLDAATDGKHAWFFWWLFAWLCCYVATNEFRFLLEFSLYSKGGDQAGLTPGTWRYDLTAHSWTQPMPSGVPGAGAHFGYDVDQTCGTMFLAFGDHDDRIDVSTTDLLSLSMSPLFARLPATTVPRHGGMLR